MKNNNSIKKKNKMTGGLVQICVCILLIFIFSVQAHAQLTGYAYKDAIKVHENAGNQAINYQVLLTVNTAALVSAGKMQASGNDIRFSKDCTGSTLLNYYIESGMNSTATKIWVEIDTLPASSDYLMYMWYGNSAATAASSFANTFPSSTVFIDSTAAPQVVNGTNSYSWFEIRSGATVTVGPNSLLVITARKIKIAGTLNGNGAGYLGGLSQADGSGPGAGKTPTDGNAFGDGGGGASYGGVGGTGGDNSGTPSAQLGQPGATYGTPATDSINMGSGGGGGSTTGGAGGGGISLSGNIVEITGTINDDGSAGTQTTLNGGGGGGSGGGILVKGSEVTFSGNLTANGGKGGNGAFSGGGGGGGRIKIFYDNSIANTGSESVAGGQIGSENTGIIVATPGDSGTYNVGTWSSKVPTYTLVPHVTLNTSSTTVCQGMPVQFTALSGFNAYNFYINATSKQDSSINVFNTTSLNNGDMVKVLAADARGCMDTSNKITVKVNPAPVVNAGSSQVICQGASANLGGSPTASGGTPAYTYSWMPSGNLNNSASANPVASPTATTVYTVTVNDANGCQSTDTATVSVQICTGIQSAANMQGLRLYPTLNQGIFTIEDYFTSVQPVYIELHNMLGEKVKEFQNSGISGYYKRVINISDLPDGIYFLEVKTGSGTEIQKLIKN